MSEQARKGETLQLLSVAPEGANCAAFVETLATVLDRPVESVAADPGALPATDCVLVDAAADIDPDRLAAHPAPVVVRAEAADQAPAPLLAAADTVVEIADDAATRRGYCERVRELVAGSEPDPALAAALDRVEGPLGGTAAYFLVGPDGDVEWASDPLASLPGIEASTDDAGGFEERLTAAVDGTPGAGRYVDREGGEPVRYLSVPDGESTRHYRRETHRLDAGDGRRLEVLREVTGTVDLAERLGRFQSLVEGAQDGLYTLDETGTIDFCNGSFASMLGYEPAELVGVHASTLTAGDEFEDAQDAVRALRELPDTESLTVEAACEHREGHTVDVSFHFSVLESADGTVDGMVGVARDVTDRAERERELERYETLVNAATDPMFAVGPEGHFTLVNDAFLSVTGLDREEAIGADPELLAERGVVAEESVETWQAVYGDLVDSDDRQHEYEFAVTDLDGDTRVLEARVVEFDAEDGSTLNIFRDITERREREEALRAARDRMELALGATDAVVWTLDMETDELTYHPDSRELYGDSVETLDAFFRQVHPEDRDEVWAAIEAAVEGSGRYEVEFRTERDGTVRWVAARGRVERGDGDEALRMTGVTHDVTDRVERERELRAVRERMELALEATDAVVWDLDLGSGDVSYYPGSQAVYGDNFDTLEGFFSQVHPEDQADVRAALESPGRYRAEFRTERDGSVRWVAAEGRAETDRDGDPETMVGVARDITDQKERERALERAKGRYETLVDSFPDGAVFLFDEDLTYTLAGGAGLEPAGLTAEEFEGSTPHEVLPERIADELAEYYRAALAGEYDTFEQTYKGLRYRIQTVPVRDDDGTVISGMAVAQDITERKERQRQLRRERDKLARLETVVASVQPLTETLTGANTRGQLESELCARLADSAAYTGAWVGGTREFEDRLRARAAAGLPADYFEQPPGDGAEDGSEGPVARALRTGEPQTVGADDEGADDARSVVAVPLTYRSATHGVLAVQHAEPGAVTDRELSVLSGLGRRVGQAVTAIENRRLLRGDRAVEVRFDETPASTPFSRAAVACDCALEVQDIARVGEAASLFHLVVEGAAAEAAADALEDEGVEFARVIEAGADGGRVQCRHAGPCPLATLVDHGGTVSRARFEPEGTTVVAAFAPGADTAAVADAVTDACQAFEVVSKRERDREPAEEPPVDERPAVWDRLTDRQQEVLRAAYHAGYYEWPRETTAEELADALGVSSPTLGQHFRKAHARLVSGLVGATAVSDART